MENYVKNQINDSSKLVLTLTSYVEEREFKSRLTQFNNKDEGLEPREKYQEEPGEETDDVLV